MPPSVLFSGNIGLGQQLLVLNDTDSDVASGGKAGYSQQVILLHPHSSSFICLHNAQTVPLLVLPHLSATHLNTLVAPTAGWPLGDLLYPCYVAWQETGL